MRAVAVLLLGPRFMLTHMHAAHHRMLIRSAERDIAHMKADLAALPAKIASHERAVGARRVALSIVEKPLIGPPTSESMTLNNRREEGTT